jgi:hypothetical protein
MPRNPRADPLPKTLVFCIAYVVPNSNHRKEPIQQTTTRFHFKKMLAKKPIMVIQSAATI